MSKHKNKDKEKSRDERRSRERDRSREKERRKRSRSRSRSKDRKSRKKSKDRDRDRDRYRRSHSRSQKSSRRDRSRDRSKSKERSKRSRSRSNSHKNDDSRNSPKKSKKFWKEEVNFEMLAELMASNSSSTSHVPTQVMTSSSSSLQLNAKELAAARAKQIEKAKNILSGNIKLGDEESLDMFFKEKEKELKTDPTLLKKFNPSEDENSQGSMGKERRKKKSRWASTNDGTEGKTFIPGMPTILPSNLNSDQQEAYLVQIQIEEITRKLKTGDLGIAANPEERSPSPEPVYSSDGKRLNTREFRTRKKLEEQRHSLITRMQSMNPEFKPPSDYKPPVLRVSDKVLIPQEEHPDINFVGLLIGPRGNTLKAMEKETGAKIIIRGKGSVKEGKVGRKDGQPLPGEDEPLHAFITAGTPESVNKAVEKIKEVIRQGIEVPEGCNDLRRMQLRELAQLNGTLRETDGMRCSNCGSSEHKSWLCPDKPNVTNNIVCSACGGAGHIAKDCKSKRPGLGGIEGSNNQAKIDEEYLSLMAELGEVPPEILQKNEPQQPPSKPFNIFDTPRHQQQPRAIGPPQSTAPPPPMHRHPNPGPPMPPMSQQPPWHQPNHAMPPAPPPSAHPMGQYPPPLHPPINSHSWPMIPPLPGQMNLPPPSIAPPIPPIPSMAPPGTELSPPGTEIDYKPSWNAPPLPSNNYWGNSDPPLPGQIVNPPLPSFLPPPPPPE